MSATRSVYKACVVPPENIPGVQAVVRYAGYFGPFGEGGGPATRGYPHIVPLVVPLLFRRSPPAVIFTIRPVGVFSVQGVLPGWLRPHVRKEAGRIMPFSAYRNAPPPVVRVTDATRVVASAHHVFPGFMLSRATFPVRFDRRTHTLIPQAPARLRVPGQQVSPPHPTRCPAGATTLAMLFPVGNHKQPGEGPPGKIASFFHAKSVKVFSTLSTPNFYT